MNHQQLFMVFLDQGQAIALSSGLTANRVLILASTAIARRETLAGSSRSEIRSRLQRLRIGPCGTRINSLDVEENNDQHRFDGKAWEGQFDTRRAVTFDLLTGKEVIP